MTIETRRLGAITLISIIFVSVFTGFVEGSSAESEIILFEGWNLISLPLTPEDTSIEVVLANILDNVEIVWGYDMGEWSSYLPAVPELGDLTEIVEGRGYWIKLTEDATLTVRGESANTRELALFEGWNIIGLPLTPEDPSIEVVLANILDNVEIVWGYDMGEWSSYLPAVPELGDLTEIVEGRGYWIKVSTDVIWEIDHALIPLAENVTVHFIDVGQGDSIFVDTPALDMLIDGGSRSAGETVVAYLQTLNVTRVDFVVATHPHADHIGGLITVLEEYSISQIPVVIDSGYSAMTVTYQDYVASVGSRTFQVAVRGSSITLDEGVEVTILNPTSPLEFDDANDNSIVIRLQVYNVTFLFTGDSEAPSEASILGAGLGQSCTVLKVGHHGSRTSTSSAFLEVVDPEVAVISVGEGNRYGHPHQETVEELVFEGVTIYRTDLHGSVEITTDGVDYSVKTELLDARTQAVTRIH